MVYLRARFYEPEMNRFSQKDILRGSMTTPQTLNHYACCINDSVNFIDPSGMKMMTYQAGGLAEDCSRTLNTIIESSSFEYAIIFSLESNGHGDLW